MDDLAAFLTELRSRLEATTEAGQGLVVASVVRARGSTPRKPGAHMLIDPHGGIAGTIGGGCGEAEVLGRAQKTLATGEPQLVEVRLLEEDGFESPSICGGVFDVFLERVGDQVGGIPAGEFFSAIDDIHADGALAVATVLESGRATPGRTGRKTLVDERGAQRFALGDTALDALAREAAAEALARGRPVRRMPATEDQPGVYAEPFAEPPEVVIVGAGHVGAAVTTIAARSGFVVTVLDDRSTFANPIRLPEARRIVVGDPPRSLAELAPRRDRHVVLVTRGHRLDAECLEVALAMDLDYLGMIGSRRRVRRIREWLLERGASQEALERLHAPIGLDIGAETPSEIAVSIVAEIIAERRRGGGRRSARDARPT